MTTRPVRLGIAGIHGRMGQALVPAITQAGAVLVGGIGRNGGPGFAGIGPLAAACDAVIDFSNPAAVPVHAHAVAASGCAWILGTTGLDEPAQAAVLGASAVVAVVQAANFSIGLTLLAAFAHRLGATLPAAEFDAEILEMHHRHKRDAPSGSALALGAAVAAGRGVDLAAVARRARDGHTGPRSAGEIGFAVQRGGEVVGDHALSFTGSGEQITLAHRAFNRGAFATGAVQAAIWACARTPGLYGMDQVLGL